jgi:hypothetical protein
VPEVFSVGPALISTMRVGFVLAAPAFVFVSGRVARSVGATGGLYARCTGVRPADGSPAHIAHSAVVAGPQSCGAGPALVLGKSVRERPRGVFYPEMAGHSDSKVAWEDDEVAPITVLSTGINDSLNAGLKCGVTEALSSRIGCGAAPVALDCFSVETEVIPGRVFT